MIFDPGNLSRRYLNGPQCGAFHFSFYALCSIMEPSGKGENTNGAGRKRLQDHGDEGYDQPTEYREYSDAAEPPVRCGVSHLSGQA